MKVKVISLPYIFQVLYVLCFTNVKISGERFQDQWSSGLSSVESFVVEQQILFGVDLIHISMISEVKVQCYGRGVGAGLEV